MKYFLRWFFHWFIPGMALSIAVSALIYAGCFGTMVGQGLIKDTHANRVAGVVSLVLGTGLGLTIMVIFVPKPHKPYRRARPKG